MRRILLALPLAAALAVPAVAAAAPSVTPEVRTVAAGERLALAGSGWSRDAACEPRVEISRRLNHGVPFGTAAVAEDGTFAFFRRVARATRAGSRIVLDVTQYCETDGQRLGTTKTVTLRVARPPRQCPGPITVDERAYQVSVVGSLGCTRGTESIGAFLDVDIDPSGFDCERVDPRTGHDAICRSLAHPERYVIAKRLREV